MAELKLKKATKKNKQAVFEFTYMASLNISSIENSICDSGNINIIGEFSGQSDEDLLNWIEGIIKYCHDDDPRQFIDDWNLYCDELLKFEVRLKTVETK